MPQPISQARYQIDLSNGKNHHQAAVRPIDNVEVRGWRPAL